MTCEEAIKKNLCLGCALAELNPNVDNCEYREKSGLDMCKKILKGEQIKISKTSRAFQSPKHSLLSRRSRRF